MAETEESVAGFSGTASAAQSGGGAALQYQHYNVDTNAHGFLGGTLTRGNRSVPTPASFFSNPPNAGRNLSGGQFGSGHAKASLEPDDEAVAEE